MFYANKHFKRFPTITTLIVVFALSAIAFLFTGCAPASVPVSGNVKTAGVAAAKTGGVVNTVPGQEYRLVTNAQGVRVAAPETPVQPGDKTYSVGGGYWLVIHAGGGEIVPPVSSPVANRQVKLGAGDVLAINGGYGRVISSDSPVKPEPQDPNLHQEALGGGFWLVTGSDGAFILQDNVK